MGNRIRILATGDIHGYIYPYSYNDGMTKPYGLARLSTLISLLRDDSTIVIDNGDSMYGSPLSYYHFQKEGPGLSPVTRVMEKIGYDYINLGNHDFSFGTKALTEHVSALKAPCITSNVTYRGEPFGPTWVTREVAGKKIAVFGLLTQYTFNTERRSNVKGFRFRSAFETAAKTAELIRTIERPDYVICVYHGGLERDPQTGNILSDTAGENEGYRILKEVHGIDVLITGHQHSTMCGESDGTVYTQTAKNGAELACIDIYTDTGVIEPRILKADTEPDQSVLELVKEDEQECQAWLDEVIGVCDTDTTVKDEVEARLHKTQAVTLISRILKEASGADLSAFTLYDGAGGMSGKITNRNLFTTLVQPGTLVVKKLSGRILREYLEKCASFWSIRNDAIVVSSAAKNLNYDITDGIEYTIRVSNDPGRRIEELTCNGMPVEDDMEFDVCFSSYRAAGGGGYAMLADCPVVRSIRKSSFEIISEYIKENRQITLTPVNNITVIR